MFIEGVGTGAPAHPVDSGTPAQSKSTTSTAPKVSKPGPVNWSNVPGGEVTYTVSSGDSLSSLARQFYGEASAQTLADIELENPTQFNKKVPADEQGLKQGVTLTIASPQRLDEIHTVQQDYAAVQSDASAVTAASTEMRNSRGMVPHEAAYENYTNAESTLTAAQAKLKSDLQPLLLPDTTQGYTANAGAAQAAELGTILPAGLQPYIKAELHTLQSYLNKFFGSLSDPNSLRADIESGNWTAAEKVEQQEITAAGKGISNPAQQQSAMALYAQQMLAAGPQTTQYGNSINQAFDAAAVQPLVARLKSVYVNGNNADSDAEAFAAAFKSIMTNSTPQVRVALVHDLVTDPKSPLLQVAQQLRIASNAGLPSTTPELVTTLRKSPFEWANTDGNTTQPNTQLWQIQSKAELSQTYQDLAGGLDLAAIGDTVGSGTGMIHQVAQAILGNPKSGGADLQTLMPGIQAAAANGNVNLSAEIALCLNQSGQTGPASAVLSSAAQGVAQLKTKVQQDYSTLQQLPQSLQIPVGSVGAVFSDPQTTVKATKTAVAANPSQQATIKAKLTQDLNALDADGQAIVRVDAAVNNLSPALLGLSGTTSLQVSGNNLVGDPTAQIAVSLSPAAQQQLSVEAQQQAEATAIEGTIPDQAWTQQRGFQDLPPGVLWIGRDVTAYVGQVNAKGPAAPLGFVPSKLLPNGLNFNLTANVSTQINSLAQSMGGKAPVNIEAVQAEITAIKNRAIVLSFGGAKTVSPAAASRIASLQKILDADPGYKEIQALTSKLALTSNSSARLSLMNQISAVNAKSTAAQLQWMKGQAASDPALAGDAAQINSLETEYGAAQKQMASINATAVAAKTPPTQASIDSWLNRAGQLVQPGSELDTDLKATLGDDTYQQLRAGTLTDPLDDLPSSAIDALQTDAAIKKSIGAGPAEGLLPTTMGGTVFGMLDLAQKFGGAAYLLYLGLTQSDQYNLNVQFAAGLAAFSVAPSAASLGGALAQKFVGTDLTGGSGASDWITEVLEQGGTVDADTMVASASADWLTSLLKAGGPVDRASLFALGVGNGTVSSALGTVSGIAWTPMMYEWAATAFENHQPVVGSAVLAVGSSYLLPLLFADSAWAGPASAAIDIVGIAYILGDTIYQKQKQIYQYTPEIQELLTKAGVKPDVAAAIAKPDSQGIAGATRLGQIFDAVPYYNTSNKQLNDQRRLAYLNSLTAKQASELALGLTNMPIAKDGSVAATGKVNLFIPPPPASFSPAQIETYYENAYRAHGLQPPPEPGEQLNESILRAGGFTTAYVPENQFADYYGYYTACYEAMGKFPSEGGPWGGNDNSDSNLPFPRTELALMPSSIQGFMYYTNTLGIGLHGMTS